MIKYHENQKLTSIFNFRLKSKIEWTNDPRTEGISIRPLGHRGAPDSQGDL